jgi:glycine/D-amino acid oxidase-like deaminating enzyme
MKLYAGNTYWDKTLTNPLEFPGLTEAKETGVLIAGGGMSGNLCAYVLSALGMDVVVVEKSKIGKGSSIANTGLLQYCSDKMLCEFVDDIGEERAYLFYKMCLEAMDHLTAINGLLMDATDYRLRDSIYYASGESDKNKLIRDYEFLKKYDFPVEILDRNQLMKRYAIDKSYALRTWHDADVNPYKFIQALVRKNLEQGVSYFENTKLALDTLADNEIHTEEGYSIKFEHLILTTGYAKLYADIKAKTIFGRTYAFCSQPLPRDLWKDNVMIWETKMPYLYIRTTADNRIIAGGLDENEGQVEEDDAKIMGKAKEIALQIEDIFPALDIRIAYAWNALFYGTKDGLPFIGRDPQKSNIFYLLGFEGNGTCYSMAGALILQDYIAGRRNLYQDIVKIDRS